MNNRKKTIGLVVAVLLALTGLAIAHDEHYHGGSMDARQHGYQHGYRDGLRQGRDDRAQGLDYDYNTDDYRMADRGYDRYMGERDDFQKGYREGYRSGYDDGFYGRASRLDSIYGIGPDYRYSRGGYDNEDEIYERRHWGSGDVAYDIGYRDGVQQGEKDLRAGKQFRPDKNERWEDADHGYRKSYGDKKYYKQQYRRGFMRGYQDAYNRRGYEWGRGY